MTTYLVDFENVKNDGLHGIANLSENDKVCIFYSVNADKITFSLHEAINASAAEITYQNVEVGAKNALDFQLVTYLGYLIAKNPEEEFVVVSNDNGYSKVIGFWNKRDIKLSLVSDLSMTDTLAKQKELYCKICQLVEGEEERKIVLDYIQKYKTKQGLNNALVKVYGSTKGGQLYKCIKPLIHDKKGK